MFKWLLEWGEEVKNRFQAVVPGYFGGGWKSNGYYVNPTSGLILADTGPLSAGIWHIVLFVGSTASLTTAQLGIQLRNKSNDVNIVQQRFGIHNNIGYQYPEITIKLNDGERVRIVVLGGITGSIQASLIFRRLFPLIRGQ